mgnify:CR=1 FL=1
MQSSTAYFRELVGFGNTCAAIDSHRCRSRAQSVTSPRAREGYEYDTDEECCATECGLHR